MSDVFISYARSTAKQAQAAADALKALGYSVWLDDELLAHHAYTHAIEEQLTAAKVALVIWSAEAVKSEWVLSEANRAREDHKLVQLTVDGARLPMPFDQTQCADLAGWTGDAKAPGWRKVAASVAELVGGRATPAAPIVTAPLPLPSKPSIAVMPFANLSGDPEQEYFADGMVAEITTALSRIRSIFVIASGSTLSFKGMAVSPQDAARQLGVRYVLEGSVRKAAKRVRIAVQLVDAADGSQLWADRFEDTLDDIFALQDSVALSVAGKIEPTVREAEIRRASARLTENPGSYDLYLRAFPMVRSYVKATTVQALNLLSRAIELDPSFGLALCDAAMCHLFAGIFGWSDDPEANRRSGIDLARRAFKCAGDDAYVLSTSAVAMAYLERDVDAAVAIVDRAISLNPGCSDAWQQSASVRLLAGESDVAIQHVETAMRLDPLGPERSMRMILVGWGRFQQGRFKDAIAVLKEVVGQADNPGAYAMLAAAYAYQEQEGAALEALGRYRSLSPQSISDFARSISTVPAHIKLLEDGVSLAEGKRPAEDSTGG